MTLTGNTEMGLAKTAANVRAMMHDSQRSASLTAQTEAINLAVGEPDFDAPTQVIAAMKTALDLGFTHYADFAGDLELREAIAEKYQYPSARPLTAANIQITSGATAALAAVILATTNAGDRVVMPDPTYSLYADLVRLAGGTPVPAPTTRDHHLDTDVLKKLLPGARSFVYCNPVNPTGAVYSRRELEILGEIVRGSDTLIVDDAAYSSLVYQPHTYTSALEIPDLANRTVLCQTFSKKFAMTGFRVGFIVAPDHLIAPIAAVHRTFNGAINSAAQRAALTALTMDDEFAVRTRQVYTARMNLTHELLSDIPEFAATRPEGAFYAFPRILTGHTSNQVVEHLLSHGVKVRSGSEFGRGGDHYLRISFSTSTNALEQALIRTKVAMTQLC